MTPEVSDEETKGDQERESAQDAGGPNLRRSARSGSQLTTVVTSNISISKSKKRGRYSIAVSSKDEDSASGDEGENVSTRPAAKKRRASQRQNNAYVEVSSSARASVLSSFIFNSAIVLTHSRVVQCRAPLRP